MGQYIGFCVQRSSLFTMVPRTISYHKILHFLSSLLVRLLRHAGKHRSRNSAGRPNGRSQEWMGRGSGSGSVGGGGEGKTKNGDENAALDGRCVGFWFGSSLTRRECLGG